MKVYKIKTPLEQSAISELQAGDKVLISGIIYAARDAAHSRFDNLIKQNLSLPVDLQNQIIYYMGPTPPPPGKIIGSAGPTTSTRMDQFTPALLDIGLKGMIGKGERTQPVIDSIIKNKAVYFIAVGGAGALLSKCITECQIVAFEELGAESLKKLTVKDFPCFVAIDSYGKTIC
ncbi:MAG: Fe-S-containing hydro-lyase [Candidatus Cloacimonetes bacterium]|nr:Fe-S-containing hydro-lyase [Candidatus Cloacimonadota bacterium]